MISWSLGLLLFAVLGCAGPGPIAESRTHDLRSGLLEKVAVVPFYPVAGFDGGEDEAAFSGKQAADLVSRFIAEALTAKSISVVAPNDLVLGFEATGQVLPRGDVKATADLAARQFGATAVALGSVHRYRERRGEALGASRPASVWFEFALYTAPGGEKIWSVRFDQTQKPLSADLWLASQYPGSGSRWLSAGELAQWGAAQAVAELPQALR